MINKNLSKCLIILTYSIELFMENTKNGSSLQQKLQLLKTLREGKLEESEKILANLSLTSRTNPALYQKFHTFLSHHRPDIEQIQNEEREQQPKVLLVQGSDDEWMTDDSVSLSSKEEDVPQKEELQDKGDHNVEKDPKRRLMKNVSNTKSTILLHAQKEVKRPFFVQTKAKQGNSQSTLNLKPRGNSVTKIDGENKSLITTLSKSNLNTLSKSNLLTKTLTKQPTKPYFPPINARNSTLKLK